MKSETNKTDKAAKGTASTIILALAVVLCLAVSIQVTTNGYVDLFGFSVFRVVTGSMEPTLPVGSILLSHSEPIENIQKEDIVCFRSLETGRFGHIVTHRVRAVLEDENGNIYLETKGDANLAADAIPVQQDNLIGRVVWYSGEGSFLQSVMSFITGKVGFLSCIVFPILLMTGLILRDNVRSIQKELRKAREELLQVEIDEADSAPAESVFTPEEYQEMYERIRAELMEELKQNEANQVSSSEQAQNEER